MLKDLAAYKSEVRALAEEFKGTIRILCGIEAEFDTGFPRGDFDYVIGSQHFITAPDGVRFAFDESPEKLFEGIRLHFGGRPKAFVKAYFAQERELVRRCDCEILGHLDLVRKFNAKHPFFSEREPWYRKEIEETAEAIAASGKLVEVNTGAIARGWRKDVYPSAAFRRILRRRGVRFVLSSDAHSASGLDAAFDRFGDAEDFVVPF